MRLSADDAIILSYDEARILLYSLGFTRCEGIRMPEKDFSAQEVLQAMHKLAARGLLQTDKDPSHQGGDDRFIMQPQLQRMMTAMGDPAGTFIFRPGESLPGFSGELYNGREYFCYTLPDYCLVTERDWTRRDSLRLRAMDMETFTAWQKEREQEAMEELFSEQIRSQRKEASFAGSPDRKEAYGQESSQESSQETEQALTAIL